MKKKSNKPDAKRIEQEEAWIGDTVLDLFARSWILENNGTLSGEMLRRMTCNNFLACFGNPTTIEARIGKIYADKGLQPAFDWIEAELLPRFKKQELNLNRQQR